MEEKWGRGGEERRGGNRQTVSVCACHSYLYVLHPFLTSHSFKVTWAFQGGSCLLTQWESFSHRACPSPPPPSSPGKECEGEQDLYSHLRRRRGGERDGFFMAPLLAKQNLKVRRQEGAMLGVVFLPETAPSTFSFAPPFTSTPLPPVQEYITNDAPPVTEERIFWLPCVELVHKAESPPCVLRVPVAIPAPLSLWQSPLGHRTTWFASDQPQRFTMGD